MSHSAKATIIKDNITSMLSAWHSRDINLHSFLLYKQLGDKSFTATATAAPLESDGLHRMFSVSKTVTAIAIGILFCKEEIRLNDKICQYFPEFVNDETDSKVRQMTIDNMLSMQTAFSSTTYKNQKSDYVKSFFTTPSNHTPGTIFHYDTSASHVLCALVEKLTGKNILDFIRDEFPALRFSNDSYMLKDPEGISLGGTGLIAHPSDLLKLGRLFLDAHNLELSDFAKKYNWNTNTAVLKSYLISASTWHISTKVKAKSRFESFGYGYYVWMTDHDGFMIYGMGGQFAAVYPKKNLILVTTADTQGKGDDNDKIFDYFYDYILNNQAFMDAIETIDEKELALVPTDYSENIPLPILCEDMVRYSIPPQKLHYILEDNTKSFTEVSITTEEDNGTIYLKDYSGFEYVLDFGFGNFKSGIFPRYNMKYLACAEYLTKNMLYIRFNILDDYMGSVHVQLAFSEDKNRLTAYMRKIEESLFDEFDCHIEGTLKK